MRFLIVYNAIKIARVLFLMVLLLMVPSHFAIAQDNSLVTETEKAKIQNEDFKKGVSAILDDKVMTAIFFFEKAANTGLPIAMYWAGSCYEEIDDYQKAYQWYLKGANKGNSFAQNSLGSSYFYGKGVSKNMQKAIMWWTKAAEKGNGDAQCHLGYCYATGTGVSINPQKAIMWWSMAAEQGNEEAQYNLGELYYWGDVVKKDIQKAVVWYIKAAKQGVTDAQFRLGELYYDGEGVTKDYKEAKYWMQKAAMNGHTNAEEWLRTH